MALNFSRERLSMARKCSCVLTPGCELTICQRRPFLKHPHRPRKKRKKTRMAVSRRRLFKTVAFTVAFGPPAKGADPALSLEVLRNASTLNGTNLSDDRLRILQPVLEQRQGQLQGLRAFQPADTIAPTPGILEK